MSKSLFIERLVRLSDLYCAATGRSRASVSKALFDRGGQIDDLESGKRDILTSGAENALRWFFDNWPTTLEWPFDIPEPAHDVASFAGAAA